VEDAGVEGEERKERKDVQKDKCKDKYLVRVHYKHHDAIDKLSNCLKKVPWDRTVILCIGSDLSTGDSLGPLVGHFLKYRVTMPVYGTLKDTVHATNVSKVVSTIKEKHNNPFILAVDSSLSEIENIGMITVREGPIEPGKAVNKDIEPVGDMSITGVVNAVGFPGRIEYAIISSTPLSRVYAMASVIAESIHESAKKAEYSQVTRRG